MQPTEFDPGSQASPPAGEATLPLPSEGPAPDALLLAARADQARRWARGQRVRVEDYLRDCPSLGEHGDSVLQLAANEFLLRQIHGEQPTLEEYQERFPDQARDLASLVSLVERALTPTSLPPQVLAQGEWAAQAPPAGDAPVLPALPGYALLGELGRGGMGVVFKAQHLKLKRLVAVKMILGGGAAGSAHLERFRAEAQAVARLSHPNIVAVHEVGEYQGLPYFTLEYCDGGSLAQKLNGTPLPAREAADLVRVLARAMHAAHDKGIIHRDLKPANVLLSSPSPPRPPLPPQGERGEHERSGSPSPPWWERGLGGEGLGGEGDAVPKITDFGLAKKLDEAEGLTQTGSVMGTPSYMAPEQAQGQKEVGPPADIYSLGAILYECLTGRPPFKAAAPLETLMQVATDEPVPPSRLQTRVPRDLETICLKCLQKAPGKRYKTANDLADDLQRFLDGRPVLARPVGVGERLVKWARRRPALAALSALCLLLTLVGFALVSWKWREADAARAVAQKEGRRALDELERAESALYANSIALAEREWLDRNVSRARQVLQACPAQRRGWEWHLLANRCAGGQLTRAAGQGVLHAVAFTPDGQRLATAGHDGTVKLWDLLGGETHSLSAHSGPVLSLAFAPDGKRLATAGADGAVKLWDLTAQPRFQRDLRDHKGAVCCVAFSPDGKELASAGEDEVVRRWQADTGKPLGTLPGHRNTITSLAYGPKGPYLASAGADDSVILWDLRTGKDLHRCEAQRDGISGLAFTPEGETLLSAAGDGSIATWAVETGKLRRLLRGHKAGVTALAAWDEGGGARVVSAGDDHLLKVWDLKEGRELFSLAGHTARVHGLRVSPSGEWIASAGDEGTLRLWYASGDPAYRVFSESAGALRECCFSPDGDRLFLLGEDGRVRQREVRTGRQLAGVGSDSAVTALAVSSRGLLALAGHDRRIRLVEPGARQPRASLAGNEGKVACLAFSRDGRWLASGGPDRTIRLWDVEACRLERTLTGHQDAVVSLVFSPDGRFLTSAGEDRVVRRWEVSTGQLGRSRELARGAPLRLAVDPRGEQLAVGTSEGEVLLLDADLGRQRLAFSAHTGEVRALAFSPDGSRLATAGADQTVRLWDAGTGQPVLLVGRHEGPVSCLAFRPDGAWLASGGEDSVVKVWSGESGSDCGDKRGLFHAGAHERGGGREAGRVGRAGAAVPGRAAAGRQHRPGAAGAGGRPPECVPEGGRQERRDAQVPRAGRRGEAQL